MPKKLVIHSCTECADHRDSRDHTEDSFELCVKWWCVKLNKHVRRQVGWNDVTKFIPDDCPLEDD